MRASARRWGPALVLVLAALILAIAAAPAAASYDPVGSGSTRIVLTPAFAATLRSHGVGLSARGPATLRGRAVTFPVSGGRLDPVAVRGSVDHEGALVFRAGAHRLPMKALRLKTTQARSPLSAKFGGGQLKLAASARLQTRRAGFGLAARVTEIRLSAKVATRLDKKLGLRGVFAAGQSIGTATTDAQPETVAIKTGGGAQLALTPEFAAKLQSLFVAVNPIFPAEHLGAPFTLPIASGQIAPDASTGVLRLAGSLEAIQQEGGQAFLRDPVLDFGAHAASVELELDPSPPNPGALGRVPVFDLGAGAASSEPKAREITVAGVTLALQAATARELDEAFAKPQGKAGVFAAGEAFATISFAATAE
jgi:hypothetical protein